MGKRSLEGPRGIVAVSNVIMHALQHKLRVAGGRDRYIYFGDVFTSLYYVESMCVVAVSVEVVPDDSA